MEAQTNFGKTQDGFDISKAVYYLIIALFLFYLYKRKVHIHILQLLGLVENKDNIETFKSLLIDSPTNDIVLTNPDELPVYRLGTAVEGSYPQQMGLLFRKSIYPVDIITTRGGLDNIIKLINKELDIAFVDEELLLNFVGGEDKYITEYLKSRKLQFTEEEKKQIVYLASLYYQPFILVTKQNSGVLKWSDLKGRKIGVLSALSNSNSHLYKLLAITDIEVNEEVTVVEYNNQNSMINAFRNELDAIYFTSNQKNKVLLDLSKEMKLRFISPRIQQTHVGLSEEELDKRDENIKKRQDLFKKQFSFIFPKALDLNYFYQNINMYSYLDTYATRMILVARRDLDSVKINYMIRNLIKNLENLQLDINQYQYNEKLNNVVGDAFQFNELASAPLELDIHVGAVSVYEEKKLIKFEETTETRKINQNI